MPKVLLSLGSNMGESRRILKEACNTMQAFIKNMRVSRFYRTAAQDYTNQPDFVNICIAGYTSLAAESLLKKLQTIEIDKGRIPLEHREVKGPRPLDIDIIFYGEQKINTQDLTVPHSRYRQRAFVLIPLMDIFPEARDPVDGARLADILNNLPPQGVYCLE